MQKLLNLGGRLAAAMLVIDAFGFLFWFLSGQLPADNFYIGTITAHMLGAIL